MKTKQEVKGPGMWTEGEDASLRRMVRAGLNSFEVAQQLNRLERSVRIRALILHSPFK